MHVVHGPERRGLAEGLASAVGAVARGYERQVFPDGERYVRLSEPLEGPTALIADLRPGDLLIEALVAADAVREAGGGPVWLCAPYLAYGRQDRAFQPGEAVSSRAVLSALGTAVDALVTVDVHAPAALKFFPATALDESAGPEIAAALSERSVDLVLAPDEGARERASAVAELLDAPFDHLDKTRLSANEVRVASKDLDVRDRRVAIVDDIISTGGTMATATRHLLAAGAARVVVAATHGLFVGDAVRRLTEAGVRDVMVTDAVPTDRSVISCAGALARGVRRLG